jgi:hypothetical protein
MNGRAYRGEDNWPSLGQVWCAQLFDQILDCRVPTTRFVVHDKSPIFFSLAEVVRALTCIRETVKVVHWHRRCASVITHQLARKRAHRP